MKYFDNVKYYETTKFGFGMHILPRPYPQGLYFNFNDVCDVLDLTYQKRRRTLDRVDELHKMKIRFTNVDGCECEESFVSSSEVSRILTAYGAEINAMMERKYELETLVYDILNEYDPYDKNKEEGYTLGDKFVLNTLYCDSILADKANSNLIDLLRKNDGIESLLFHRTEIDYEKKDQMDKQFEFFRNLADDLEELTGEIDILTNELESNEHLDVSAFIKSIVSKPNKTDDNDELRRYM